MWVVQEASLRESCIITTRTTGVLPDPNDGFQIEFGRRALCSTSAREVATFLTIATLKSYRDGIHFVFTSRQYTYKWVGGIRWLGIRSVLSLTVLCTHRKERMRRVSGVWGVQPRSTPSNPHCTLNVYLNMFPPTSSGRVVWRDGR